MIKAIKKVDFLYICRDIGVNPLSDDVIDKIEPFAAISDTDNSFYRIKQLEFLILEVSKKDL